MIVPSAAFLNPQHCGGLRVFRLEPGFHFAASVRRAEPLRYDAFEAQLAGVLEDSAAVTGYVLACWVFMRRLGAAFA
jgi:hypothetical protein